MLVVDNRKPAKEECFADLPLGATYKDEYGFLCIKIANDDDCCNCLTYDSDGWTATLQSLHDRVTICPTKLIIEG